MNIRLVANIISKVLLVEASFMTVPLFISLYDREWQSVFAFLITIAVILAVSLTVLLLTRKAKKGFYAQEGFVTTGLAWIMISAFGALPFVINGEIPNYIDAWFEIVSGFTTTGSTILADVEILSRGTLYWRSFSHWLGGMGVLVFILALIPAMTGKESGSNIYLLRAESPGPTVGKLVPKMKQTAVILYFIYILLTVANIIFLLFGGMSLFDSVCIAFGTAGTGGFGVRNDSIASYGTYVQIVTTVFMMLFGVNFNLYFLLYTGKIKSILKNEELRCYLAIFATAVIVIVLNIRGMYSGFGEALKHSAFQTASIMTTTGYTTVDFEVWPMLSKAIMLVLMCIGASAGSTGGGIKVMRFMILLKTIKCEIIHILNPRRVEVVRVNGKPVGDGIVRGVMSYMIIYVAIAVVSFMIISIDGYSIGTNVSAVIACFNNIGPGFESVGAICNFSGFSAVSKIVLSLDMLLGRLEIFPLLVMLTKPAWKRNS